MACAFSVEIERHGNHLEDIFRIGVITEPHGVRGEVKVFPTTDEPERIKNIKEIILDDGKEQRTVHPEAVRHQKNLLLIKFKEFNDRDEVERLRKRELFVSREYASPLKEDEYYISDLIGLKVIDEEEQEIGTLNNVMQTGANDVYQILMKDGKEVLLPAIRQCVLQVDIEAGYMRVHVMDGLV